MARIAAIAAAAALTGASLLAAPTPGHAASSCSTPWGSTPGRVSAYTAADVVGVRAGRHACFDRLVIDVGAGSAAGWSVSYVSQVTQPGSGAVIPTRGGARVQVVVHAAAYDDSGRPTYQPARPREVVPVGSFSTFRQVVWGGSFEGETTLGIGLRARLPFRAFAVSGPGQGSRVVIDVAHRW